MLNGIDISSWQGNIDVAKVPGDFVIVKATEGTSYVNPYCDSRYQVAKKAGKLLGVYHYAKNGNPEAEAEFFYKNIKGYVGQAILFLDYEEGLSANSPNWCRRFLDKLKSLTGGVKGMLYTYQSMLNSQNWQTVKDGDYGLWYASYGLNNQIAGFKKPSAPTVKYWGTPAIYQYSSRTRLGGYSGDLDANVFYGDAKAWKAYATAGKVEQTPQPSKKTNEAIAQEVIDGKWGTGAARVSKLKKAGYDPNVVQKIVNQKLAKKSVDAIAREVIAGKWGNNPQRAQKLKSAGYDVNAVQNRVNQLM